MNQTEDSLLCSRRLREVKYFYQPDVAVVSLKKERFCIKFCGWRGKSVQFPLVGVILKKSGSKLSQITPVIIKPGPNRMPITMFTKFGEDQMKTVV